MEIGIQVPVTMKDVRDVVIKGNELIKEKISRLEGDFFMKRPRITSRFRMPSPGGPSTRQRWGRRYTRLPERIPW
jgi:hypothetical protein